ncbi:hypothetical protein TTHERM_00283240 (macronuclear) [Tetrahymena thermophila SB210]|uniref:Transmembrane protein n=1 Tax=Tetrahymena thermophila (strain SB210) TaxID=312017 RepID=I7MEW6_TETTS|nr:hypothetical protein TTHERM_00283240 [Tetrahymena thermophila SB210]EAR97935.1 hypothetical protein TTHERM_00283240 [Tetrahymena thermophila SB210]|eukprot:XP_001018180.1 hypothetical protein TTHERM_00283240 [Tetrahymena thermophila SB210]
MKFVTLSIIVLVTIRFAKADITKMSQYQYCVSSGASSNMWSCDTAADQDRCNQSLQSLKDCYLEDFSCFPMYALSYESYVKCFTDCSNKILDPDLRQSVQKLGLCLQGKAFSS